MHTAPATVVQHESASGRWQIIERPPHPALRPHVRSYQGYVQDTVFTQRQPPSGAVPMILGYGSPLRVRAAGRRDADDLRTFVAGLHDTYAETSPHAESAGVQVNLTPIGAHLVLGVPMHTLTNRAVELDEVAGELGATLAEQLHDAPGWDERFALIDDVLARRLAQAQPVSPAVAWAWRELERTRGTTGIGALATAVGWSRKHLVHQFREYVGVPPKTLARVLRFHHARTVIDRGDEVRWADIAYRCRYYDQAHLIRDFNRFIGMAPGEYVARRVPGGGGLSSD
jgi:AraC-like DNA-binding protein